MPEHCKIHRDLTFFEAGHGDYHRLDLYSPAEENLEPDQKCPVIIHVHGGGWQRGSRKSEWRGSPIFGRACAAEGMVVVAVNYRLAGVTLWSMTTRAIVLSLFAFIIAVCIPGLAMATCGIVFGAVFVFIMLLSLFNKVVNRAKMASHPEQVRDVARSIAWVYANLASLCPHADLNQVFISGHSAGGHLASLVALDRQFLLAERVPHNFVKGVIAISGIYTVDCPLDYQASSAKNFLFRMVYTRAAFGTNESAWSAASPIEHVSPSSPPFCVISASSDYGLEVDAARFYERLTAHQVFCTRHTVSDTSHATIISKFSQHAAKVHVMDFVRNVCHRLHAPSSASPYTDQQPDVKDETVDEGSRDEAKKSEDCVTCDELPIAPKSRLSKLKDIKGKPSKYKINPHVITVSPRPATGSVHRPNSAAGFSSGMPVAEFDECACGAEDEEAVHQAKEEEEAASLFFGARASAI